MYNYNAKVEYDTEKDDIDNYQKCFLTVFNLDKYDNEKINEIFDFIISKIKEDEHFKPLFEKEFNFIFLGENIISTIVPILFSYQSFKYMHLCLKDFFTTEKVSKENMENLENSLNYLLKK